MGWRIDSIITGGLLDNTEEGRLHGFLLLRRCEQEPLKVSLDLEGNLEGRLLGRRVEVRPRRGRPPVAPWLEGFSANQTGRLLSADEEDGYLHLTWPCPDTDEQTGHTTVAIDTGQLHIDTSPSM